MDAVNAFANMEYIITSKGRFRILKLLSEVKELNISEICRRTQTAYLSTKQHLQTLKRAGLLEEKNFGRIRLYRYREEDLRCQILKNFFEQLQQLHPLIGLPLNHPLNVHGKGELRKSFNDWREPRIQVG